MKMLNNLNSSFVQDQRDHIINSEWLETSGLGTWAASSISGINTNRNHGLLITKNSEGKIFSLLSKLEECVMSNGQKSHLSANQYPGTFYPKGYEYLQAFSKDLFPEFIYQIDDIIIHKTIAAIHGTNSIVVKYTLLEGPDDVQMSLLPLITSRSIKELTYQNDAINSKAFFLDNSFSHQAYKNNPTLHISFGHSYVSYKAEPKWYNNFEYETQHQNGEFYREDMFSPGEFTVNLHRDYPVGIIISSEKHEHSNPLELFKREKNRRIELTKDADTDYERLLKLAADQFVIRNSNDNLVINASYFDNEIRSRENVIGLTGILISTGRYDEARELLTTLKNSIRKGLLPEFLDEKIPVYKSADTSLWFFDAVYQYFKYTEDTEFIYDEMMPVLKDIIAWFLKGTNNNICVDSDGLIIAGTSDEPATWMNAQIDGWAITPRAGKAVEINALWFNALKVYAYFLDLDGVRSEMHVINDLTENIQKRFKEVFWNKAGKCLYDLVDENNILNDRVRPNQLFAISLSFPVLSEKKAKMVLDTIEQKLVTDYGIKTLCSDALGFKPKYEGNDNERKLAYHEGTVWNWLMGAYIDALIKLQGKTGRAKAKLFFNNFKNHLSTACIGNISELFNATEDFTPNGSNAYSLSVAEILRVGIKYNLFTSDENNEMEDEERNILGYAEYDEVKLSSYIQENEEMEEEEVVAEQEDLANYNNPFSIISAFRSPGSKFSRLFSLYNFG
ncbi:MAG: hypothetical protein CMO01_06640 [Thalassobius sp.]|nr:hypothetical protein [Thalassovita sp.]